MEQEKVAKPRRKTVQKPEAETDTTQTKTEHKTPKELKEALDALLHEVDEVLVENAEVFVRDFVQKGGQ